VTQQPRVAVVLVNYGDYAQRYLSDCYRSLLQQTYPATDFTIFIVHNGVEEAERRHAANVAPTARFLGNDDNRGWGGGNNTAIRAALDEGFDCCVLLNIDSVAEPEWLQRLVEAAQLRPDAHILQSAILLHGTDRINSIGNRIQFLGYGYCYGYGRLRTDCPPPASIDYASGAAMLVKRSVFEAIGLFREEYFMYYDDVEFCWRARLAGFNIGLAERSICHHKYTFETTLQCLFHIQRNRLLTLLTLERAGTLLVIAPALLVAELLLVVYFPLRGWGAVEWRVLRELMRVTTWRWIAEHRRAIKVLRRRTDAEIVRGFSGGVVFAEVQQPILRYLLNPLLQLYWCLARQLIRW